MLIHNVYIMYRHFLIKRKEREREGTEKVAIAFFEKKFDIFTENCIYIGIMFIF